MREIKFRGKASESVTDFCAEGDWVYGSFIADKDRPYIVGEIVEATEDGICPLFWIPICPETVGQFTGLLDKDGREIYEGDILLCHKSREWMKSDGYLPKAAPSAIDGVCVVVWKPKRFEIVWHKATDEHRPHELARNYRACSYNTVPIEGGKTWWPHEQAWKENDGRTLYRVEVIGNIHDNPELLEKK